MKTVNISYPTCWEEVTSQQLLVIASALQKKLPRNTMLLYLLCHLSGLRVVYSKSTLPDGSFLFSLRNKPFSIFRMGADIVATACKDLEYILDSIGLPECPIPGINKSLYDIPFENYYTANALFCAYTQNNEPAYLRESASILAGKKQPKKLLNAYALWFTGLQHHLKVMYPHVFAEGEQSDVTPAKQLHDLLSILNKDEPHLDKQIMQADVHSVLTALNNKLMKIQQQ